MTRNKPFSNCVQFSQFPARFLQPESFAICRIIRVFSLNKQSIKWLTLEGVCTHWKHFVEIIKNNIGQWRGRWIGMMWYAFRFVLYFFPLFERSYACDGLIKYVLYCIMTSHNNQLKYCCLLLHDNIDAILHSCNCFFCKTVNSCLYHNIILQTITDEADHHIISARWKVIPVYSENN